MRLSIEQRSRTEGAALLEGQLQHKSGVAQICGARGRSGFLKVVDLGSGTLDWSGGEKRTILAWLEEGDDGLSEISRLLPPD